MLLTLVKTNIDVAVTSYSDLTGVRSIVINPSVCLSVHKHISGAAGPIVTKFVVQIPRGRGSVLLWQSFDMLCTSSFLDGVTFGSIGPHEHART